MDSPVIIILATIGALYSLIFGAIGAYVVYKLSEIGLHMVRDAVSDSQKVDALIKGVKIDRETGEER